MTIYSNYLQSNASTDVLMFDCSTECLIVHIVSSNLFQSFLDRAKVRCDITKYMCQHKFCDDSTPWEYAIQASHFLVTWPLLKS